MNPDLLCDIRSTAQTIILLTMQGRPDAIASLTTKPQLSK